MVEHFRAPFVVFTLSDDSLKRLSMHHEAIKTGEVAATMVGHHLKSHTPHGKAQTLSQWEGLAALGSIEGAGENLYFPRCIRSGGPGWRSRRA